MTTQPKITEKDIASLREHTAWLEDCGRWKSEHRQTLAILAKVQATIMEQEAALESFAATIQTHDMHLQRYSLTEYEPGDPDYEFLEQEHAEFIEKHERAKEAHARLKNHHVSLRIKAKEILSMCESAM